jgi:hypothetical protein
MFTVSPTKVYSNRSKETLGYISPGLK